MARLTAGARRALPGSAFVFPKSKAYPINDAEHARKALQLGAKNASPAELARIKAAVKRRYPGIGKK